MRWSSRASGSVRHFSALVTLKGRCYTARTMHRTVLFLCTGNFYRSRFAEAWFNHLASQQNLPWRAESAGLAEDCWTCNKGPLSPHVEQALREAGIATGEDPRCPVDATPEHFERATRVIALHRVEHEPLLRERFGGYAARVEYWGYPDVGEVPPKECLPALRARVAALVNELGQPQARHGASAAADSRR